MPDLVMDRLIAAIGDAYIVDREIGRGGMGIVYQARDVRLKRPVAIKLLPPELAFRPEIRSRFLREAETAAQLSHPNIVPIYAVDEREGLVFFVMALVDGENLGDRLARTPRLPTDQVARLLREVADALAYAHRHGIVHRDIKPDNIILDRTTGRPMVTDFGIARAAEGDSRLTVTGVAIGTPAYMSPEQALGERELDGRSDLYSLGIVAYQMLTGALPFTAANTPAMLMKHINETPRPIRERRPDVPAVLAAVVERALAKRPADRWASAAEMREALEMRDGVASPTPSAVPVDHRRALPLPPPPAGPLPAFPSAHLYADGRQWRDARRQWKREMRSYSRAARGHRADTGELFAARPIDERIRIFRRTLAGTGATVAFLAGINLLTFPHFWWFVFPTIGMGARLIRQWGALWSDGVPLRHMLGGPPGAALSSGAAVAPASTTRDAEAARLAPAEVLAGPYGDPIRRAVDDRLAVHETLGKLGQADRELIPADVASTADALAQRVASLAQALHRMGEDLAPEALARLEARIADAEREGAHTPEHERRLALLQRQRESLRDLVARRATFEAQLDSAGLALQNLRLDLLKLRASGVQSSIDNIASATQEARALSREIGHVLDAARELRAL